MIFASSCWRWLMAAKEIDCGASEIPWITPVSCTGKKPLGTTRYSTTVSPRVAIATSNVSGWCLSTHCNLRP
ncbi:hypothetical protein PFLmoz3_03861 [Pseudomonas fluorescens]|uniref:Uncharacterized protein n=1 Tax=Pseudomonas fluorescens TaxID=294 RepID=A0A120G6Y9_PSEFL|nr:hypothetical protein PFLmoz3_03861 [Pseudomonas fluorescens]